jgi:hypothetical protein
MTGRLAALATESSRGSTAYSAERILLPSWPAKDDRKPTSDLVKDGSNCGVVLILRKSSRTPHSALPPFHDSAYPHREQS